MAINASLLGYQRRNLHIGELRMGYSIEVAGRRGRQPMRSDTWRFTTGSEAAAEAAAEKYGGEVEPWDRRKGRYLVVTTRRELVVYVPPRGEAVDTSMELWDGPACRRRCDGAMMSFPDRKPCMCPLPRDPSDPVQVEAARAERERLAGLKTPGACKPLTRYKLTIPDLPGALGIWRLNTGSVNAAVESADSGAAMELAREMDAYLAALLYIDWRPRGDGSLAQVPVLMIGPSMQELADHALPAGPSGLLTQLKAPAAIPAIEAPAPPPGAHRPASRDMTRGTRPAAGPVLHPAARAAAEHEDERRYLLAQSIADDCAGNITSARFTERWTEARDEGVCEEFVYTTSDHTGGPCQTLDERLRALWADKRKGAA